MYEHIQQVWESGSLPTSWTDTHISLLYKKGDPSDAGNYRPIAVACCMCQVLCKLLLPRLKTPLQSLLSPYQGGGRKGYTIIT